MPASKSLRTAVAVAIVTVSAVAFYLLWWTGQREVALRVPITLSLAVDDTVWVSSHGALHEFNIDGLRVQRLTSESLGLPQPVLHLHAVRRDDLLVSAGEPMRVYRCTPSQRQCHLADAGYIARFGAFKNAVWLGANADGSRVVVSDNAAHRVAVLDADGALLAETGGRVGRFHFPGQPVWVGQNTIWLASADHHRIERFEFAGGAIGEPLQTIALEKSEPSLAGRIWPMALAPLGDRQWLALVKANMMTVGGLVRVDEHGRFGWSARLPEGADLTAVTRLGQHIVAAELGASALVRLSLAGGDATPFGSDEFQAELRERSGELAQWRLWQQWAQWLLIGAPILGIGLLLLLGEELPQAPQPEALREAALRASSATVSWRGEGVIGVTDQYRKQMRQMLWLGAPLMVLTPALFIWIFPIALRDFSLRISTAVLTLFCWGSAAYTPRLVTSMLSRVLRVQGETVSVEREGVVLAKARLAECWTDGRKLVVADAVVILRLRDPVFEPEAVQALILSRIPQAQWLGRSKIEWLQYRAVWRNHPRVVVVTALLMVTLLAVDFLPSSVWRDLWHQVTWPIR